MDKYLTSSEIIDWKTPLVMEKAKALSQGLINPEKIAKECFKYVRDEIKHSNDYQLNPVKCRLSL